MRLWKRNNKSNPATPAISKPLHAATSQSPLEGAEEKISTMKFLAKSARDINSTLKLEEVFKKIAERVHLLIDFHLFCLMLWNEDEQLLEHAYSLRYGVHVEKGGGFPRRYGIAGAAAETRMPVRVTDVRTDARYVRYRHPEVDVRSEIAVPLVLRDKLIGVLDLESTSYNAFTEEHEAMLCALAMHIATALENARLYEETAANEKRLAEDLEMAREIQMGLLPRKAPNIDGFEFGQVYIPARELAGDFYDFLSYGDGRIGIALGDVAGKSTPAALYASLAVGIMRGHALKHFFSPAEMLAHMNKHLHFPRMDAGFVAMLFSIFDSGKKNMTVSNAGCPWPLLIRNGHIEEIRVSGEPLGLFAGIKYDQISIELEEDDVVVFFSDGLQDSENERGEAFGSRSLANLLERVGRRSAQQIADELIDASSRHVGKKADILDDRTVVVVRYHGREAGY